MNKPKLVFLLSMLSLVVEDSRLDHSSSHSSNLLVHDSRDRVLHEKAFTLECHKRTAKKQFSNDSGQQSKQCITDISQLPWEDNTRIMFHKMYSARKLMGQGELWLLWEDAIGMSDCSHHTSTIKVSIGV